MFPHKRYAIGLTSPQTIDNPQKIVPVPFDFLMGDLNDVWVRLAIFEGFFVKKQVGGFIFF